MYKQIIGGDIIYKESDRYKIEFIENGKRKSISYSESAYGKYAEALIILSDKTHIRYNNYIERVGDISIIHIYSKKYGYFDAYFDTKHFDKVSKYRWSVKRDRNTFYVHAKNENSSIRLHNLILEYNGIIDHIDRNGLNNLETNLRICSGSTNARNSTYIEGKLKFPGLSIQYNLIYVKWRDNKGNRLCKAYSIKKYGYNKALKKAKRKSILERLNNGYIIDDKYINQVISTIKINKI